MIQSSNNYIISTKMYNSNSLSACQYNNILPIKSKKHTDFVTECHLRVRTKIKHISFLYYFRIRHCTDGCLRAHMREGQPVTKPFFTTWSNLDRAENVQYPNKTENGHLPATFIGLDVQTTTKHESGLKSLVWGSNEYR